MSSPYPTLPQQKPNAFSLAWKITSCLPAWMFLLVLLGSAAGCRSLPRVPARDFSAAGWTVRQGQAIWKPSKSRPELIGEILLATNQDQYFFIQFTKTPFPFVTAQKTGDQWEIEFGSGRRHMGGVGKPSSRFAWFQLPAALEGRAIDDGWSFARPSENSWSLHNRYTGESMEGTFFP